MHRDTLENDGRLIYVVICEPTMKPTMRWAAWRFRSGSLIWRMLHHPGRRSLVPKSFRMLVLWFVTSGLFNQCGYTRSLGWRTACGWM
jgi:hypothetical protein